jgi:hypothetical protein
MSGEETGFALHWHAWSYDSVQISANFECHHGREGWSVMQPATWMTDPRGSWSPAWPGLRTQTNRRSPRPHLPSHPTSRGRCGRLAPMASLSRWDIISRPCSTSAHVALLLVASE